MEISSQQRAALEAAVAADPGAPAFAALAELQRRAQRPDESERIARLGLSHKPEDRDGRVVLALALIDQGRVDEAREELSRLAADVLASHAITLEDRPLSDDELDRAFDRAETQTDELIDPHRVAEEALSHVDGADAALDEVTPSDALVPGSAFATATMAELLERQGDTRGAARIRRVLEPPPRSAPTGSSRPAASSHPTDSAAPAAAGPPTRERRSGALATLERWLDNLRGERA